MSKEGQILRGQGWPETVDKDRIENLTLFSLLHFWRSSLGISKCQARPRKPQMRELLATNKKLARKLVELEKRLTEHDENFQVVFEAIKQLLAENEKPKRKIGF